MKFRKIKLKVLPVLAALSAMGWVSSCNNSDESANNSTTPATDSATGIANTDNTITPAPDTSMANRANTGKKRGKVSVAMTTENKTDKMSPDKSGYYNYAEVSPFYNGGQAAIENYINNNLEYPQEAIDNNVEGTVRVQFGIDENGKIANVKTIGDKIGYGLEEEAVRVISGMPGWTPGQVKGKNVKTWVVLPVTYRIDG
jgi:periplasmic protein TonB